MCSNKNSVWSLIICRRWQIPKVCDCVVLCNIWFSFLLQDYLLKFLPKSWIAIAGSCISRYKSPSSNSYFNHSQSQGWFNWAGKGTLHPLLPTIWPFVVIILIFKPLIFGPYSESVSIKLKVNESIWFLWSCSFLKVRVLIWKSHMIMSCCLNFCSSNDYGKFKANNLVLNDSSWRLFLFLYFLI